MDFGQLSQYTAAMFAEMPHCEKVMWHMRSKEDKNRYQKELANYKPQTGYDAKGDITEAGAILLGISLNKGKGSRSRNRKKNVGVVPLPGGGVLRRNTRSKRDHNFPKRNLSAFLLYQNYMRHILKNNNGHPIITSNGSIDNTTTISSFGDIATYSSQTFKKLSPEEKGYWDQMAEDDKVRFQKQLAQYKPSPGYDQSGNLIEVDEDGTAVSHGSSAIGGANPPTSAAALALAIKNSVNSSSSVIKKRRKRTPRDASAPKRSSGAYVFFTNYMRPIIWKQQPNLKFVELGKVLGQKWRALSKEDRAPYEKLAEEDKARYQREIKAYNEKKEMEEEKDEKPEMDYSGVMGGVGGIDMMSADVPALSPNNDPHVAHSHGVQSSPNVHAYAEHIHVQSPNVSDSNHVVGADGAYGYANVGAADGAVGEAGEIEGSSSHLNLKKDSENGLEDGSYYAA